MNTIMCQTSSWDHKNDSIVRNECITCGTYIQIEHVHDILSDDDVINTVILRHDMKSHVKVLFLVEVRKSCFVDVNELICTEIAITRSPSLQKLLMHNHS